MKSKMIRKILIGLFVAATAAGGAAATTLVKMTLEDLGARASLVVRGRCVATRSGAEQGEIWTWTTFEVSETLKGTAPREILVRMLGGRMGHLTASVEGVPRFTPGEDVFLFLEPVQGSADGGAEEWAVTGWVQGTFRVMRSARTGEISVWQDTGEVSLFDARQKQFLPGGIRQVSVEEFRRKVREAVERALQRAPNGGNR